MPDASEFVVFEVDFFGITAPQQEEDISDTDVETLVQNLNGQADKIAKDLQTEVAQVFQPLTSGQVIVHVGVNFRSGTIVVEGLVIAVLTAMGTIASQTISQALGQNLATLLQRRLRACANRRVAYVARSSKKAIESLLPLSSTKSCQPIGAAS